MQPTRKSYANNILGTDIPLLLQQGMNLARKFIWKQMSPSQKARHLLRQAVNMVKGK